MLIFQGISGGAEDRIALDVHSITELQDKKISPTDDKPKYTYTADAEGIYKFEACVGKVIALRQVNQLSF